MVFGKVLMQVGLGLFQGLPKSRHIPRIVIDPKNHDIVYAAVLGNIYKPTEDRGVYKSVDGGQSWNRVLFSNKHLWCS